MTTTGHFDRMDYSEFSSMSPMDHGRRGSRFHNCTLIKTEVGYDRYPDPGHSPGHLYNQVYPSSPHALVSCMYSTSLSSSAHSSPPTLAGSSKENKDDFVTGLPPCRRRLDFNHNSFSEVTKEGTVSVARRNERERNRVKLINMTFHTLRQRLPLQSGGSKGKSRKLSKVQTLRSAIDYIRELEDLIEQKKQLKQENLNGQENIHGPHQHEQQSYPREHETMSVPDNRTLHSQAGDFVFRSPGSGDPRILKLDFEEKDGYHSLSNLGSEPRRLAYREHGGSPSSDEVRGPYSTASSCNTDNEATCSPTDEDFFDFEDWF